MSRCIACNTPVDALSELCGSCAEVSGFYLGEALRANDEPLERDTRGLTEFTAWLMEHPEIEKSWAYDGLGLMEPRARSNRMYLQAKRDFLQARGDGLTFRKACEVATKGAARGNQRFAADGLTHGHSPDSPSAAGPRVLDTYNDVRLSWDEII